MSNYYPPNTYLRFDSPPTAEEEQELFCRTRAGDIEARDTIIKNHLLFVAEVARRAANGRFSDDEVVSAANEALVVAVTSNKFDHTRGNRFTSYLRPFIKGVVSRMHKDRSKYVALPESAEAPVPGQLPSVASETEHESEGNDFAEFVSEALKHARGKLSEQEQRVISLTYEKGMNHAEIGREFKVTRERIRQIHDAALEKLKKLLARNGVTSR